MKRELVFEGHLLFASLLEVASSVRGSDGALDPAYEKNTLGPGQIHYCMITRLFHVIQTDIAGGYTIGIGWIRFCLMNV